MEIIVDEKSKVKSKSNSRNAKDTKSEKINIKLNKNVITQDDKKIKKNDNTISFVIVEKNGSLKDNEIQESLICAEELSKKCKFKKVDRFIKRTQWSYSSKNKKENVGSKIIVELWAKDDGIANSENKYEFPPPVDTELFFGACALIARDSKNNYINLTKDKWNKIYEYLFGGFESLTTNDGDDDDDEEDELDSIPKSKKTRDGYLKDGFVVDGGPAGDSDVDVAGSEDDDDDDDDDEDDDDSDGDKSSENDSNDGDGDGDGDGGCDGEVEGIYFKKNKNTVPKTVSTKMKLKGKHNIGDNEKYILKEEDDDAGWKTDESSELSEEEYSYSK